MVEENAGLTRKAFAAFPFQAMAGAEADGGASRVAGPEEVRAKAGCPPHAAQILPCGTSSGLLQLSLCPGKYKRSGAVMAFSRDSTRWYWEICLM